MRNSQGFRITGGRGFHVTFANGWTVSVQFGPGNYCDNYNRAIGWEDKKSGDEGSSNAECAFWPEGGDLQAFPDGDTVQGRMLPVDVLKLMNEVAGR